MSVQNASAPNIPAPNVYDQFEYPGYSFPATHPDRLAVMASLHGLSPAPVAACRVLEIGCGEGANLIPMAWQMPAADFTGFDLAAVPIARGQQRIRALGLTNIRLFQSDLMDFGRATNHIPLSQYDYVIAHGLYAWVPGPVRDRLLSLCSEHLAPGGVAFVSYNTYPGSHLRNFVRDAIHRGGTATEGLESQVTTGLDLLEALIHTRADDDPWRLLLEEQLRKMRRRARHTTCHDELAPGYEPVWFSAFVAHARQHGLEYLGESELPVPSDPRFRADIIAKVQAAAGADPVAQEELLDFARMRMYRETLLVRSGQPLRSELLPEALRQMRFASSATFRPGEHPDQRIYALPGGARVSSDQRPAIAIMERLIPAWPRTLGYEELCAGLNKVGLPPGADPTRLLLQMAMARMIDLHVWQPSVADTLSERPSVPAICRHEAAQRPYTANLWHGTVQLDDPVVRRLLLLLDGTRNRQELLSVLRQDFPELPSSVLEANLDENLERFRRAAVLES